MDPLREIVLAETRRQFFGKMAQGIGGLALSSLFAEDAFAQMPGGVPPLYDTAARRRRLRPVRRAVEAFTAGNKYQRELQGLTLSMIGYMEDFYKTLNDTRHRFS